MWEMGGVGMEVEHVIVTMENLEVDKVTRKIKHKRQNGTVGEDSNKNCK